MSCEGHSPSGDPRIEREVYMAQTAEAPVTPPPIRDERVGRKSTLARLLARPEAGALAGAIVIYIFFFIIAPPFRNASSFSSTLYVTSTYGLMATPVALLMIGGEFDLSAGVAVTSSALCASLFSFEFTTNVWVGVLVALALSLLIGFINGWIVVKTGIPSFLVTLGTFFMLQGLNLALTQTIINQVASPDISTLQGFGSAQKVFASSFTVGGVNIRITVIYWIVFVAIATWILMRTHLGNWIFSVGGSAPSARAVGVPVARMKIALFMAVGLMAWFTGMHTLFQFNTIQSGQGVGNEFVYIIAAVVGGCLLTGGYGSAIGAAIGALIFGMVNQGIVYAGPPLVRLVNAGKRYGAVIALSDITMEVSAGEVTCVLGDNGAGKSTLIKIIAGLHQPSSGTYEVDGTPVTFDSPRQAPEPGIATVYQDLAVVPRMPVWRNFCRGNEVRTGPRLDIAAMKKTCKYELLAMGIGLRDGDQPIGTLCGG